jgi:hypothetical protein
MLQAPQRREQPWFQHGECIVKAAELNAEVTRIDSAKRSADVWKLYCGAMSELSLLQPFTSSTHNASLSP